MATTFKFRPYGLIQHLFPASSTSHITRRCLAATQRSYATSNSLPKIANTSVWTSMIPRFILDRKSRKVKPSKEWNPATFYIVIFILIGSQAIRMLTLKNSYAAYTRSTDAKIELLKEVIGRIKNGENIDVEKLLGTGDEAKEKEWEEVLQVIKQEDSLWQQKSKELKKKAETEQSQAQEEESAAASTNNETTKSQSTRKANFF
ncbi:hypothetical protein N7495_000720 [Penicillium taxi]|uniref:uncharacterized protein n=1 Tax=Penicillium taxi TaxID=168475 RepID=UPI0025456FD3|nr:uncharacterized protein N7495_000720 [Penicillium taxi]KAJ5908038.1 hypothetical protein N7495_000720 [Penicillium taxi]